MRAVEVACGKMPREVEVRPDERGRYLRVLQGIVGGNIEAFDAIFGDLVATGFDWGTGECRDLTDDEASSVMAYFSDVSLPGSGRIEFMKLAASDRGSGFNPPLADQAVVRRDEGQTKTSAEGREGR